MDGVQKAQVRLSEARSRLNAAIKRRNELTEGQEVPDDLTEELRAATVAIEPLEVDLRAAITASETENRNQDESQGSDPDKAQKEWLQLLGAASVIPFLAETVGSGRVEGREAEIRKEIFGESDRPGLLPVDMLVPQSEYRAALLEPDPEKRAVTGIDPAALADGSQAPMLDRVFTRSIAARLLVSMPSVPVGAANYPVMTHGVAPGMVAPDADADQTPAQFTGHTLEPIRLSAQYLFRVEDMARLRGYEDTLRRDLVAAMSDAMDNQVINGDGNAPNVPGFLSELDAPAAADAETTWQQYLAIFTGMVDGINAFMLNDLRAVIGARTFQYAHGLFRTGAQDNGPRASAADYVGSRLGGASVSSRIPAASGAGGLAKSQDGIVALTSYPGRNAVAPVWRGVEMIRDNITKARQGQVAVTALMLWNFKILRETGFKRIRVRIDK